MIVYKLTDSETDYPRISAKIKSYNGYAKPFPRTWFIRTDKNPKEIRDDLSETLTHPGSILVIDVSDASWATKRVDTDVTGWMHKNL